ncbi:MAG: methionine synthase [Acidobacteriota bacterium]|nr:methionine synthase [Acidobacteriota bacterium]
MSAKEPATFSAQISTPAPHPDTAQRSAALQAALDDRILVLDGATGTYLQSVELDASDFGGPDLEGCNEVLVDTRPDVVLGMHRSYLAAGADVVETDTFGGTPLVLAEYELADRAFELNLEAARLARRACAEFDEPGRPRFVCGSMGPTTKVISVTGGVTFDELHESYYVQAMALLTGGADYLILETCQDTRNVKAGLLAIRRAFRECGWSLPVSVSVTIEPMGTMLAGQDAEALAISMLHEDLLYLGLNCATGPDLMTDHLRTMSELARTHVGCVPNAGLPDEEGEYTEGPDEFVAVFTRFLDAGWLNVVGGCCGTTHEHVAALKALVEGRPPRRTAYHSRALISGLEGVELTEDNRPLLVGERTNVLGSKVFRERIAAGDFESAAEIGRAQVRGGAQIIDICLQDPDREESADMDAFLDRITRMVKAPLMIDSTDAEVMEQALVWCQGKAVLNSINLEDGLERFETVVPLARRYGAALVVGLIDEPGMAVTAERKMEVARRSFDILVGEMGVSAEDIWFDPLVFPCGTGDEAYIGSAAATVQGVRRIKAELPDCRTILGISNVSFGLPLAGREVLNSVFLYHCTQAGLDAAIVNTERLARYAEVPAEERELAERLIYLEPADVAAATAAVEDFAAHFRGRKGVTVAQPRAELPLDERLSRAVVEGSKEGLVEDLDGAMADDRWPAPLDIINGPLMTGMAEVGRLFNANELIVAEVLQSAEVMKAAVSHLEPHMEKTEESLKGKVLLATVKGDVHDIGKNLVDIILTNNGFDVVNLGIKVPSETLVQAVREHRPNVIGLSGLLVKSAQQMVITAGDLAAAGIETDLLVGGAALSRRFTHRKIVPTYEGLCTYAKDAMTGLDLVESLVSDERRGELEDRVRDLVGEDQSGEDKRSSAPVGGARRSTVRRDVDVPPPPDLERHVASPDLDEVWSYINPQMLYGKHLGLRGSVYKLAEAGDDKYRKLEEVIDQVKGEARELFGARVVWRFFRAVSQGERVSLVGDNGSPLVEWTFPRQAGGEGICLADYVLAEDHLALFVTTAGRGLRDLSLRWKDEGEYLKSHALAVLSLETAEATAEWIHEKLRADWGFGDSEATTRRDLFSARYHGKRYSFGYPACPDLEGQRALFAALEPGDIGVELTESDMMDPEASVSAIVVHHPEAKYFGV